MRKIKAVIGNGLLLTVTSLFLRWLALLFNGYISRKLGAEGVGVYGLVQSVFGFAITFACAGINLGTTRLISQSVATDDYSNVKIIIKRCIRYSLFFSITSLVILFGFSRFIGEGVLGDERTVKSIRVLAISLPFISCSSVINGYFSAVRKVYKNAFIMLVEHFVCVWVTVNLFTIITAKSVESACMCVAFGTAGSEIISFLANCILYAIDTRKFDKLGTNDPKNITKKLAEISIPLALSSCFRSGLLTIEHLLIPYGLRRSGLVYSQSMAVYGIVSGMVFPVILFPACIIYAFAGIIIPELARLYENKKYDKISAAVSLVLKYTLAFSIGCSAIFICYAYEISNVFYGTSEAYEYIRLFAPLVSVMYLDSAVDGVLKGLNEQLYSMKINIADALLSVILVFVLVPVYGIKGYIFTVFVCEIFNCSMSLVRLIKICSLNISVFSSLLLPLLCSMGATFAVTFLFDSINITRFNEGGNLAARIILTGLVYIWLLLSCGFMKRNKKIPSFNN